MESCTAPVRTKCALSLASSETHIPVSTSYMSTDKQKEEKERKKEGFRESETGLT